MKKLIITTLILLTALVAITVIYFKNLNTPAAHTARIMQSIPNNAAVVFEFSNDDGFYDIFSGSTLLKDITGPQKMDELSVLRNRILLHPLLKNFFDLQRIYISLHGQPRDSIDFLMTIAGSDNFSIGHWQQLAKQTNTGMLVNNLRLGGKEAYEIYFNELKKRFYLVNRGNHIFSGSFSKELALQSALYQPDKSRNDFLQIPDQQNSSSLANLYINYAQLTPLFNQLFISKDTGLFRNFRRLPALAGLTLNYKTDALMFNGFTNFRDNQLSSYLSVFRNQQPVSRHLKDIFPSTTAYSTCFALSNTKRFIADLAEYHTNAGLGAEEQELITQVKNETGVQINTAFNNLLAGEFAVVTTRFDEKLAIIALKNGTRMRPLMVDVSKMVNDDVGQFKYDKLPFYLLGDAFSAFTHPYFMLLDNYLVLANSTKELDSYKDSYQNHKFLTHTTAYTDFDNLLAERSNVAFFLHFRNVFPILRRDMKPAFAAIFNPGEDGPNRFYALSYQLSATDRNFYTNFCMRLNQADTIGTDN